MKTLKCSFLSNGEQVNLTAIINDELTALSSSKKNQATDIIDDFIMEDNFWCLFFEITDILSYEIEFKAKPECKTLIPIKAITWEGGEDAVITDVQKVKVIVK